MNATSLVNNLTSLKNLITAKHGGVRILAETMNKPYDNVNSVMCNDPKNPIKFTYQNKQIIQKICTITGIEREQIWEWEGER